MAFRKDLAPSPLQLLNDILHLGRLAEMVGLESDGPREGMLALVAVLHAAPQHQAAGPLAVGLEDVHAPEA
eukprot:13103604-Alexandrium_andersonii.AAC.1